MSAAKFRPASSAADTGKVNPRALALALFSSYRSAGKYANLALSSPALDGLGAEDRAFVTALFYAAVERRLGNEYLICALAGRGREDIFDSTFDLLSIGLTQILYMDGVPDFAAVHETVALARERGERAFVNAVLRAAVHHREQGTLPYPDREKNPARYLSVFYSFPIGTVRLFLSLFGEEDAERLLGVFNRVAPLTVAVNLAAISREECLSMFAKAGFPAAPTAYSPMGIRLSSTVSPALLPGFAEGLFFVQDEASQIAACALGVRDGASVIDVCAAPGGTSFAVASMTHGSAHIRAFDLYEGKLSLIESGRERLGFSQFSVAARDACDTDPTLAGCADAVICDVPCSGLGVLGKKPDLRYRAPSPDLPDLQYRILTASATYLKAGGRLLYSTCTLNPSENEEVVSRFLASHPDFSPIAFSVGSLRADRGELTLLPHVHGTDGFYLSLLRKGDES